MTARGTKPDRGEAAELSARPPAADHPSRESSGRFRRVRDAPRSREEAEAQYVAARTVWVDAMHKASSGRSADLASLAIAQKTYERAAVERTRWAIGPKADVTVQPAPKRNVEVALGQELAWRRVREAEHRPRGLIGRLFGRRSRH